ncbi:hypothetical protein TNCV_2280841 [Trichonephila clavipes]|nr:hypothetical protein TNCV_2280841 [Trichonephila clavipes]
MVQNYVAKSPRVAEQCDVNIQSINASTHHGVQNGRQCGKNHARRLPGVHPEYSTSATDKPATLYQRHQPYSNVSPGTPKRGINSRLTGAGSLLPPVYSEEWAKGNAKVSPEHHFPPYGTPHMANMRVGKPTVLVENQNI